MGFSAKRTHKIVETQRANYPYLTNEMADKIVGTILSTRRMEVHITADFLPALVRCKVPLHHQKGYAQVAADYFNQKGPLIKHGKSYGIYKRDHNKKAG